MCDSINRHDTSAWLENMGHPNLAKMIMDEKRFPSVQPVQPEIIRCKDCAKRNALGYCTMFQNNIHGIATSWYKTNDDDFCSRAERREE